MSTCWHILHISCHIFLYGMMSRVHCTLLPNMNEIGGYFFLLHVYIMSQPYCKMYHHSDLSMSYESRENNVGIRPLVVLY